MPRFKAAFCRTLRPGCWRVPLAERVMRKHPQQIVFIAPVATYLLVLGSLRLIRAARDSRRQPTPSTL